MKQSGILYYLPADMFPALSNTKTSRVKHDSLDRVTGDIHIAISHRKQVITDLRKLADELESLKAPET